MTALLVAVVLLAWPYIALELALPLGPWQANAPLADLAALALLGRVLVGRPSAAGFRLPGPVGYAVLLTAGLLALPAALDARDSLHVLVRKPVFLYVVYGGALAYVVARQLSVATLRALLIAAVTLAATISLATSIARFAEGNALWFSAIEGLTNNHKTLAVAIAPTLPLLIGLRRGRLDDAVVALVLAALALSMSRTSWITAAVGLAYCVRWRGRTLASRPGLVVATVALGAALAVYGPLLARSTVQLDAARSRHSLDVRAWAMFAAHPLAGMGAGTNVRYEQQTFPHYRVNGVDAHGVVQKVGSEFGLLGLAGYAAFVGAMARRVRARAGAGGVDQGAWGAFVALHANLLFSTETFSQTHWIPLGVVWGLSQREERA